MSRKPDDFHVIDEDHMIKRNEPQIKAATDEDLIEYLARKGYCVADIHAPRDGTAS